MWDGLPRRRSGKESAWQCRRHKRHRFDPWVRKNPWSRNWQPTPVFLKNSMDRGAWWAVSMGSQRVRDNRTCLHTRSHRLRDVIVPMLLPSRFSRVWLCETPQTAAHQAPPSLGFSKQEHWSGLPFPSPMHESEKWKWSRSVVSDSSRLNGLQPTRLLRPWDIPGKSTGVGCHCLLRGCKFWHLNYFNLEKPSQGRKVPALLLSLAHVSKLNLENQGEIEKNFFCNYHKISILWNFRLQTRKGYLSRMMLYKTQYVSKYKIPFSCTLCYWAHLYNVTSETLPRFCWPCADRTWKVRVSWHLAIPYGGLRTFIRSFHLHSIFIPTSGSGECSSCSPYSMSHKGKKLDLR